MTYDRIRFIRRLTREQFVMLLKRSYAKGTLMTGEKE